MDTHLYMLQDFGNKKQKSKKNLSSGDLMVSVDEEKQSQQEDEEEVLVSNVTSFVWSLGQNKHERITRSAPLDVLNYRKA